MISSNKLSLFPEGSLKGFTDVPVQVSKNNSCQCNETSLSFAAGRKLAKKPSDKRMYNWQCYNHPNDDNPCDWGSGNFTDDAEALAFARSENPGFYCEVSAA